MAAYRGSFASQAADYLELYERKVRDCAGRLDEAQIWWRPHAASNSVGNLILHVSGNLSLWILKTLGGAEFERRRAQEFGADGSATRQELLERLGTIVTGCREVLAKLDASTLDEPRHVQRHDTDVRGVILHAVEHTAYHAGQVVFVTKLLLGARHGIEFYPIHKGE